MPRTRPEQYELDGRHEGILKRLLQGEVWQRDDDREHSGRLQGSEFGRPHNNHEGGREKQGLTDIPPGTSIRAAHYHRIPANDDQRAR
tara:strand:- start:420 stop:683 length:264 start_codon:yes stop_codon:yes gene_type:complete